MSKVVAIAQNEVGQGEVPLNSNKTKYGKWFGWQGVPWCGIFVSWCYDQVGAPLGKIGFKKGFAGCQTAVAHYRKTNRVTTNPMPGNIVFFDWNGDGRFDHTGIFVKWLDVGKTFESVEGNTSLTNQSNGGQVMSRVRKNINVLFVDPF
jgi:hypothetical protein